MKRSRLVVVVLLGLLAWSLASRGRGQTRRRVQPAGRPEPPEEDRAPDGTPLEHYAG